MSNSIPVNVPTPGTESSNFMFSLYGFDKDSFLIDPCAFSNSKREDFKTFSAYVSSSNIASE